ncbi:MAG: GGDEF domain-containing protein, partial [Rubrivivax sp.]|nr:GGDEF domain-containing protein [Rubrivivax sp.]
MAQTRTPAQLAKGALRRLAQAQREPTPENYAKAYAEEGGLGSADSAPLPDKLAPLLERLVARASDDNEVRESLVDALMHGRWEQAAQGIDRTAAAATSQAQAWAGLIERLTRGLARGGRQWTMARKKESLQRVLDGSR